jgi:hypothetical protein
LKNGRLPRAVAERVDQNGQPTMGLAVYGR